MQSICLRELQGCVESILKNFLLIKTITMEKSSTNLFKELFGNEPNINLIRDTNQTISFYQTEKGIKALSFFNQAQQQYLNGNYNEALQSINSALNIDELNSTFYIVKGDILNGLQKSNEAFDSFKSAMERGGENFRLLGRIGDYYLINKDYNKSISAYLAAIEKIAEINDTYPGDEFFQVEKKDSDGIEFEAKYFNNIGFAYSEIGTKEALNKGSEYCFKALDIHFNYSKPRIALGIICAKVHHLINDPLYDGHFLDQAVQWFQDAAKLENRDPVEFLKAFLK